MNLNDFKNELSKIGVEVTSDKLEKLDKYYNLLIEYNKVMNLTAIVDKDLVYLKHFYDSLTLNKIIDLKEIKTMCDLGSGAGFPGIVIGIFYPNIKITLVDSLNKRINFLNEVINNLNLKNISAIHSRIEDFSINHVEEYEIVTARAVASLNILLELGINLVKRDKYFISMKGNIENEPSYDNALDKLGCSIEQIEKFKLPIENSDRCLIKIKKNIKTPKLFPRKFSEIKKKPL